MILVVRGNNGGDTETLSFINNAELLQWMQTLPYGIECVHRLLDDMTNRVLVVSGKTVHFSPVTMPKYDIVGDGGR